MFTLKNTFLFKCLYFAFAFIIAALVYSFHKPLFQVAYAFLDSDMSWLIMESDRFKQGEFPAFYHRIWYGGNTFGWLRALFTSLFSFQIAGFDSYQSPHLFFTFIINPLLMVGASYFLAAQYFGRSTALILAFVLSFGLDQWTQRAGFDLHVAYYVLGCILLGIRARYKENPFLEASFCALFLLGVLNGLGIYTFRSFLLYSIVFWVPFYFLLKEFQSFLKPQSKLDKALIVLFGIYLFLFFYLETYTDQVGMIFGRKIKIHAAPNLDVAGAIFVFYLLKKNFKNLIKAQFYWKRVALFTGGFVLGFLPELIQALRLGKAPESGLWAKNGFQDFFALFSVIPRAMSDLISLHTSEDILRHSSLILLYGSFLFFILYLFIYKKEKKWTPFILLLVLAIIAFCRVKPFSPGASRYLFPLFPVFILSIGSLIHFVLNKRNVVYYFILLLFLCGHIQHHLHLRSELISKFQKTNYDENIKKINELFEAHQIQLVYSKDYLNTNTLTFASSKKITYVNKDGLYPLFVEERIKTNSAPVGILVLSTSKDPISSTNETIILFGEELKLKSIGQVGDFYLFQKLN